MAPEASGTARERAVELDRVVPPSGNVWLAGQQIWLGPAMTGRTIRLRAGLDRVHVLLDGYRIKTLPSQRGQIMVATQRIHVGLVHARKIVTVTADDHAFQLDVDGETSRSGPAPPTGRSTVTRPMQTRRPGHLQTGR